MPKTHEQLQTLAHEAWERLGDVATSAMGFIDHTLETIDHSPTIEKAKYIGGQLVDSLMDRAYDMSQSKNNKRR